MSVENKDILNRLYFVSGCLFVFMIIIVGKLFVIQFIDGDYYKGLAEKRAVKKPPLRWQFIGSLLWKAHHTNKRRCFWVAFIQKALKSKIKYK